MHFYNYEGHKGDKYYEYELDDEGRILKQQKLDGNKEKNGYLVGLYSSASYLENLVDDEIKDKYIIWVAQWGKNIDKPRYNGKWDILKYTSTGRIAGINGDVDYDVSYRMP